MKKILTLVALIVLAALIITGAFQAYRLFLPKEFRVNPNAKIDLDGDYTLQFWISRPNIPALSDMIYDIEQKVATFTADNPHIGVDIYIVPPDLLGTKLVEALELGEPPDILLNLSHTQPYYGGLQVPFGLYMSKEEKLAWPAGILAQMTQAGEIWGHPVAGFPTVLMANLGLLSFAGVDHLRLIEEGWTWEQFINIVGAAAPSSGYGLVLTNTGEPLVKVLAASIGKPAPQDNYGNTMWTKEDIISMADIWEQIKTADGVPTGNKLVDDCLGVYLRKNAAIIGPLNPFLATWLWEEAAEKGISSTVLPVPSNVVPPVANLAVAPLVLFRQEVYLGHDHTAAAALFGRQIAGELGKILSKYMGVVPLTPSGTPELSALPFDEASKKAYAPLDKVVPAPYSYGPTPGWTSQQWAEAVTPSWNDIISGKITSEEFAQAVLEALSSTSKAP